LENKKICNDTNIILNSIADGVFTIDLDYKITSINNAALKILEIPEEKAIGKYCREIFHSNICEHSCALRETLETGENIINKTIYIVNGIDKQIPISISTALLKNNQGDIIGGVETFRDISEVVELRKKIELKYTFEDIISKNNEMQNIFKILPDIAISDSSVLIEGSSGTGKELIAKAIHNLSNRSNNSIIAINCAALPDNLLESELFGYKAGAFTDARKDKPGKISIAEGGTLFLDEIGELSKVIQVKLLRFLQEKEYEPLGGITPITADVRIIAATNKNLLEEVEKNNFRDDLFYRLNVINIDLPPLKNRLEDIPLLIKHFIKKFNILKSKDIEGVSDDAMNILMNYNYPGNIRELENIIEHSFVLSKDSYIQILDLPVNLIKNKPVPESMPLEEMEKLYIIQTLEKNNWNKSKTAEILKIDSSTLWRKINKYNIIK
jgi:PAS domain S-box-containing protein